MWMPVWKLKVGSSGPVQITARAMLDIHPSDDQCETPFVPIGRARIRVVPTAGLPVDGKRLAHSQFIPMYSRHGDFVGLAAADPERNPSDISVLVVIEADHDTHLTNVRWCSAFAGSHLRGSCGNVVACIAVLSRNEQLDFEAGGRTYAFVYRDSNVVPLR